MNRIIGKKSGDGVEILRHSDFTAIPVTISVQGVDDESIVKENNRTIVKAGAILSGDGGVILEGNTNAKVAGTGDTPEGVLRNDVDITDGEVEASMIIRGDIYEDKLPKELSTEFKAALATRILFVK